ncbi:tRNA (guanosine(18)-2'-O)-methyltransferase TrmH [Paraferrimonas sp. SM1919]|uniref:tRNA (guanosine(18)-2'-O)-methyltransferase TrmH n=1 Tax=Paraferrimonas sp. SM1919 TaxID=2662263 RepID=UPI0013D77F56|nr:tRNA (guanosine(18)-2'-O)-methyltransferase TrmH [Paraferrimonas sp. SM1919]
MSPERFARINQMLDNRQPDLTVCLEMVHKSNNLAAIMRTADAVGISKVHCVLDDESFRVSRNSSGGSKLWVDSQRHANINEAITELKSQGMQVLATNLSATAVDFREIDYTKPTAIIMGQEKTGISDEALALADQDIIIPMEGMVQSLNVSVASALILYEAQRQRQNAGMYGKRSLDAEICHRILFEGGHPIFAQLCKQKGLPYPELDDQGQIVADEAWWQRIQQA